MSERHDHLVFDVGQMPGKFAELPEPAEEPAGARRGQILIMFAVFAVALMGMLGLATDVGYAMAARRATQGAADAGAIAGARKIARYTTSSPSTAQSDVSSVVTSNTFGGLTPTLYKCEYINGSWGVVGTCDQTVPSTAVGSRVQTRVTVNTFFIKIVPGAPSSVLAAGYAKARVESVDVDTTADQAPFIICGEAAWDVSSNPTTTSTSTGSNVDFLSSQSPFKVNSSYVGKIFRIMDPNLATKGNAECSTSTSSVFKGKANQGSNNGKTAGSDFYYVSDSSATTPGNVVDQIKGIEGCAGGSASPYNCVMLLPVADDVSGLTSGKIRVVGFAAFKITKVDDNRYNAELLDDFIVSTGDSSNSWCRDCGGAVKIRMIW